MVVMIKRLRKHDRQSATPQIRHAPSGAQVNYLLTQGCDDLGIGQFRLVRRQPVMYSLKSIRLFEVIDRISFMKRDQVLNASSFWCAYRLRPMLAVLNQRLADKPDFGHRRNKAVPLGYPQSIGYSLYRQPDAARA